MKTHADIVDILRAQEAALKAEFGIHELGVVSPKVEYGPVADVCLFVDGVESSRFEQLKSYFETELGIVVQLVAKSAANGSFRYAFTAIKQKGI